ncbi:MAG: carbon-nitrogen hydrolase family protein, partial [Verrucomicrobiota bacterium]
MLVLPGRKMQNLQRAVECIADAARAGARIVLLPEALTLGWTHFSAKTEADEIPSDISCSILCDAANTNKIYVCAGLVEKASEKSFNSAVLIDPKGEIILRHRKIHELDIAQNLYSRGDHLEVIETPLGTFGVMICADAFAPGQSISRTLGLMGAQMILSPCSWAMPADHDNAREPYGKLWLDSYQPVARDFKMWIAGASNVGWIEDGP